MEKAGFDVGPLVWEVRYSVWDPWLEKTGADPGSLVWRSLVSVLVFLFFCSQGRPWDSFLACLTICIGVSLQTVVKSYYELLGLKGV